MAHPICGDSSKIYISYSCEENSRCYAEARVRRYIDSYFGDICKEEVIACPC